MNPKLIWRVKKIPECQLNIKEKNKARGLMLPKFSSVHSLSHVWLSVTPWTAAHQATLSITQLLSRLVTTFLPRSKHLLISWLQSPSTVILQPPKIKSMNNLDSILKIRDITLPTKFHQVKAMVFPVVMYGCESWTVKKAEHQRVNAFEL